MTDPMNIITTKTLALTGAAILFALPARAHLGYGGRDFGSFSLGVEKTLTISGQTVLGNFGWADGTDEDFGDSHKIKVFRFTLDTPMEITIAVQGSGGLLPGFSIYSGLAHSDAPDYDTTFVSQLYLQSLGGVAKEGTFVATGLWKLGNENGTTLADLTTFTYQGYAVDGTSANFGTVPGIFGDGFADGYVSGTFNLAAGDYTIAVGGALYSGQAPTPDATNYAITTTVSSVPEPATIASLLGGVATLCGLRRRRRARS
jgi:hypothetical protein